MGRAVLYGLAAGGEDGALAAIKILTDEIDRTLALIAVTTWVRWDRNTSSISVIGRLNASTRSLGRALINDL